MRIPILLAALVATTFISCGFAQTPSTINRVQESLARVSWNGFDSEGQEIGGRCTGFSVGIIWVLTAKHCLPEGNEDVFVDGKIARVIKKNDALALLEVPVSKYPILEIRKTRLKIGEPVTTFGYAYGGPDALALRRNVAVYCECNFADTDHLIMDNPIAKGMSGGPVIDETGRVVGLNQAGTNEVSIACPGEELLKFIEGK